MLVGHITVDVARAVPVLDAIVQVVPDLRLQLIDVRRASGVFGSKMEFGLVIAVLRAFVGQNIDDGRARVKLDRDFLLIFALSEENLARVLQAAVRF